MEHTAKLFTNSRSQDLDSRDVSLPQRPTTWDGFFAALATAHVPVDFLNPTERQQDPHCPGDDHNPKDQR